MESDSPEPHEPAARQHYWSHVPLSTTEERNVPPRSLLGRLERTLGSPGVGLLGFFCCGPSLAVAATLAWVSGEPWVFPSLAPTILLVFETPLRAQASPRHTIVGHLVGILIGYAFLVVFGLRDVPSVAASGFTAQRIGAVTLAVAVTTLVLHVVGSEHPPAGATALIVTLGILRTPTHLGIMMVSVLLVTAVSWAFNRLTGVPVPVWAPRRQSA